MSASTKEVNKHELTLRFNNHASRKSSKFQRLTLTELTLGSMQELGEKISINNDPILHFDFFCAYQAGTLHFEKRERLIGSKGCPDTKFAKI